MDNHIVCPNCKNTIKLTEALSHQLLDLKKKIQEEHDSRTRALEQQKKDLLEEKRTLWVRAQAAAQKQAKEKESEELKLLKEQLEKRDKKLEEAREAELQLRKDRLQLEEEKKEQAVKLQRTLDEERKKIIDQTARKIQEDQFLKDKEKEEQLRQYKEQVLDLQRKLEQGSQQIQGEVLEVELENLLRQEYPHDEIKPVPKGIRGADVIQIVHTPHGKTCGSIIWESKRTRAWSREWITKLKEDQRQVKANFAIIVSNLLPDGIKNGAYKDGVWVCNYDTLRIVCGLLRRSLMEIASARQSEVNQQEKAAVLYNYLTSTDFRHRIEAIVESFSGRQLDLEQEKRWFAKKWAREERSIRKVIDNTMGMYGDLQSIVGRELGEVQGLDSLPAGKEPPEEETPNEDSLF